ncbi:hypothetical protein Theco_1634 [Thermobacillus composti KWC4]|uniref:Uncharacterized protein n=1 Tax=Thermobacillus composti (strain DSM 18247 / JCM 13945 / KWC4) TaxID=717605 RepID=L0EF36_THECK|nr:hypothetical protein Theco_1634 [Thermobacillus composti KWC4]
MLEKIKNIMGSEVFHNVLRFINTVCLAIIAFSLLQIVRYIPDIIDRLYLIAQLV